MSRTPFVALASLLALTACGAAFNVQGAQQQVASGVASWQGYSVDQLVTSWGAPDKKTELSTGAEVLTYAKSSLVSTSDYSTKTNQTTVASVDQHSCTVTFVTSSDKKTIASGKVDGHLDACAALVKMNPESAQAQPTGGIPRPPTLAPLPNGDTRFEGSWEIVDMSCLDGKPTSAGQAALTQGNQQVSTQTYVLSFDDKAYMFQTGACIRRGHFDARVEGGRLHIVTTDGSGENCPAFPKGIQRVFERRGERIYDYQLGDGSAICDTGHFVQTFRKAKTPLVTPAAPARDVATK